MTGGSRGIGRAIAALPGERGASVVISRPRRGRGRGGRRGRRGSAARVLAVDVADSAAARTPSGGRRDAGSFGRLDILVNNAGIAIDGLLLRIKDERLGRASSTPTCAARSC